MSSLGNPPSPALSSRSRARTCPSSTYTIAGYPYYLLPAINSCEITSDLSGTNVYVLFPLAHGISEIDSYRSTLDIQSLLVTSSSAYVKSDIENSDTLAQEDGDIAG